MKTVFLLVLMSCSSCLLGLSQGHVSKSKLSKEEKFLHLVYNDTTQALANLFILKRHHYRSKDKTALIGMGISTGVFLLGGAMLASESDSEIVTGAGLLPLFAGAAGGVVFISYFGLVQLAKSPYSFKKFVKVVALLKEGKPLPEFYAQRLVLTF
jgi:hypothetical protein